MQHACRSRVLATAVACAAVARARGSRRDLLGYDDARHLLARTGFGPTDAEVRALRAADPRRRPSRSFCARRARAPSRRRPRRRSTRRRCARRAAKRRRKPSARRSCSSRSARASSCAAGGSQEMLVTPSPAHRADDALLAQPLRVRAAEGADRAPHVPAERRRCAPTRSATSAVCCTRSRRTRR